MCLLHWLDSIERSICTINCCYITLYVFIPLIWCFWASECASWRFGGKIAHDSNRNKKKLNMWQNDVYKNRNGNEAYERAWNTLYGQAVLNFHCFILTSTTTTKIKARKKSKLNTKINICPFSYLLGTSFICYALHLFRIQSKIVSYIWLNKKKL